MAYDPIILRGNLKVNGTDVSEQVTQFVFRGTRDTIDVPATFGRRASFSAGSDKYSVTIDFLQDQDATALSVIFWDALADADGEITVAGSFEDGIVAPANPLYTATAVVNAAGMGGVVNTVATDSVTFPLTDRPVKSTT